MSFFMILDRKSAKFDFYWPAFAVVVCKCTQLKQFIAS